MVHARAGRVAGKVCIVTGAASGLGAADAQRLSQEGATVVLTDLDAVSGARLAATLAEAMFVEHDVRDENGWDTVIRQTLARFGRLDVLVNNAGLVRFADIETCTLEEFRLHSQVMLEGTFLGCKHAVPVMGEGGSIINVASTAAIAGYGVIPAYSAAKGGIVSLTRSVAVHCQDKGRRIRCNAIVPGAHATPMIVAAQHAQAADAPDLVKSLAPGMGDPADVANLVLFLASDESRRINGTTIVLDNGETAR